MDEDRCLCCARRMSVRLQKALNNNELKRAAASLTDRHVDVGTTREINGEPVTSSGGRRLTLAPSPELVTRSANTSKGK